MKPDEQLIKWVNGNSIHNTERDECCPDFSCCNKKVNTPKEIREAFVRADKENRMQFLMMFLGNAIATKTDKKVYIAGTGHEN